jgi:hypothetical protein
MLELICENKVGMPREVKRVFKNSPTLYKIDDKDGGKKILNLIPLNSEIISNVNQLLIKKLLGIFCESELSVVKIDNSYITLKNKKNEYLISILNNTFMII